MTSTAPSSRSQRSPGPRRRPSARDGLTERGWQVADVEIAPLSTRFQVTDPLTGAVREVDVLKEVFWRPLAHTAYGPVLGEEDVIDTMGPSPRRPRRCPRLPRRVRRFPAMDHL
ncbi:hypothetical protein OG730_41070 [Streptomyces sp. NBC_01298]|uniref:hypothetical protein n=1 Tax=Streptomyces sp. NBC_01298 TaxID=2903817 RepID=UPI002E116AFA|nr:hypothetical protein OG730_41070 [Streptomyces sp. NBC_01298]